MRSTKVPEFEDGQMQIVTADETNTFNNVPDLTESLFDRNKGLQSRLEKIRPNKVTFSTIDMYCEPNLPTNSKFDWANFHIENRYSLETLAESYKQNKLTTPAAVLVFANGNCPGGHRGGAGQEENLLSNSNLGYGMPDSYTNSSIWHGHNGIYAVRCMTLDHLPFWAIVMAAPNLNSYDIDFTNGKGDTVKTPSDAKLFGINPNTGVTTMPKTYMRHLVGEVLMQFYMVSILGSKQFITGMFGCNFFGGDPEYYAAAVKVVSSLPQFANINVSYALGQNNEHVSSRNISDIFINPAPKCIELAKNALKLHFMSTIEFSSHATCLSSISRQVRNYYFSLPGLHKIQEEVTPSSAKLFRADRPINSQDDLSRPLQPPRA